MWTEDGCFRAWRSKFKLFAAKSVKKGSAPHTYANSAHRSTALRLALEFASVWKA